MDNQDDDLENQEHAIQPNNKHTNNLQEQTQFAPQTEQSQQSPHSMSQQSPHLQKSSKVTSKNEIRFLVQAPIVDPVKGCTTYFIHCSSSVEIRRRYNDFWYFRECLRRKWPGLYIPPVPEKKLTGNKEQRLIDTRRKMFQMYLNGLPWYMVQGSTTDQFLKNPSLDMEKYYSTLATPRFVELVHSYKEVFKQVNFQTEKPPTELQSFSIYLKQAEKEINFLRSTLTNLYEARSGFNLHLASSLQTLLPSYEADVYKEYSNTHSSNEYESKIDETKIDESKKQYNSKTPLTTASPGFVASNPFEDWMDCVHYEALELQAMQECLRDMDAMVEQVQRRHEEVLTHQAELAKLLSGRTTFKSLFSKGSKSEQIIAFQRNIPQEQTELKQLRLFLQILNAVMAQEIIPEFRRRKRECYYRMMKQMACEQMKYLSAYGNTMRTVIQATK